jgi:outer membrane lipoprotein-sorting protein
MENRPIRDHDRGRSLAGSPFSIPGSRFSILLGLALSTATLSACPAHRPLPVHVAPAVLPSASDLNAALTARRQAVRSLRAVARLHYRDPAESNNSREALVVARPDRIRVEVLSVFGSLFVLTADDGALTAYARQEDTVYRGQASPENLWRYARLWLPVADLVEIVLGTPPQRRAPGTPQVEFDAATGWISLRQTLASGAQSVWFSDTGFPVAAEERNGGGQVLWHATFAQYEDHGGIPVATRVGLELPAWSRSIDITLEDVDVNPTLDRSIFAVQTPPGSKVVNLDHVVD